MFCIVVLGLVASCASRIGYTVGVVTGRVEGIISFDSSHTQPAAFIVVKQYNRTFMETSKGYLHSVSAVLVFPKENGEYSVPFNSDVDQLDLFFFAKGHRVDSETFPRTLGIGSYHYNVALRSDPMFRESFYLSIKPMLSEFILEDRYEMPQNQQMFLSDWFREIEETYPKIPEYPHDKIH